ncbi:MAG TPA: bacteriohemerythrin [Anaeromyxobacteraceae bacterium]
MALTWDTTLVMGVPALDEQHQELFQRVDALLDAIRRGSSREEVGRTLSFVCDYVQTHFAAEEALMLESGYPALSDHKAQHDAFAHDLAALEAEHRRNGPSPSLILRVNARISGWLRDHIYRADRALAEHLRAV